MTYNGVEYPASTSRLQVPLTRTGRFMAGLVSLDTIDFAASCWRTFQDYFRLIHEFALMARTHRTFLWIHQTDVFLLDMYLGKDSPVYGPGLLVEPNAAKPRKPLGNKQFMPDVSRLLTFVSLMVWQEGVLHETTTQSPSSTLLCLWTFRRDL